MRVFFQIRVIEWATFFGLGVVIVGNSSRKPGLFDGGGTIVAPDVVKKLKQVDLQVLKHL